MMVQGPQAFRADVLRGVHADEPDALEDSELVERNGGTVVVVPGETRNIHVITPSDLVIVAGLIG
jgi:2-C-methyl-D-erythritol 4-phosphate cytidylyltransferase